MLAGLNARSGSIVVHFSPLVYSINDCAHEPAIYDPPLIYQVIILIAFFHIKIIIYTTQ